MRYFGLILCSSIKSTVFSTVFEDTGEKNSNSDGFGKFQSVLDKDQSTGKVLSSIENKPATSNQINITTKSTNSKNIVNIPNIDLDHQFQIRSNLDSSLCLTRSRQQKLILDVCDLKNLDQWFKYSEKRGLISNWDQLSNKDLCFGSVNNHTLCGNQEHPLLFSECNMMDLKQSWQFIGSKIHQTTTFNGACSISIDQHDEFRRVYAIPDQFDRGLPQLIKHALAPNLISDLMSHGCWCANLNGQYTIRQDQIRYSQAMVPIDRLDTICRDWMNTRKCVLYKGGACFRQPRDGRYARFFPNLVNKIVDLCDLTMFLKILFSIYLPLIN